VDSNVFTGEATVLRNSGFGEQVSEAAVASGRRLDPQ
jgi:hypothetical protein